MWGTSLSDDKLTGNLGNVLRLHESEVVRRIVYHQAILDFCSNIPSIPVTSRYLHFVTEADIGERYAISSSASPCYAHDAFRPGGASGDPSKCGLAKNTV